MAISVTVCVCVRVWSLTTRSKQATPVVLPYPTPWPLIPPCSPQFIKKSQAKRRPKNRSPSLSLYLAVSVSSLNLCCACLHTPSLLSLSLSLCCLDHVFNIFSTCLGPFSLLPALRCPFVPSPPPPPPLSFSFACLHSLFSTFFLMFFVLSFVFVVVAGYQIADIY